MGEEEAVGRTDMRQVKEKGQMGRENQKEEFSIGLSLPSKC